MDTHVACADTRARIGAIVVEAIRGLEDELGMSVYEHVAAKYRPAGLKLDKRTRLNAIYCFRLLQCGRWLPLNRFYRPLGIGALDCWRGYEAYAAQAVHFPADPRTVLGVWRSQNDDTLWLYNDDPAVRQTYFKRFARICAAMAPWRVQGALTAPG
jgi:hypothetical protein